MSLPEIERASWCKIVARIGLAIVTGAATLEAQDIKQELRTISVTGTGRVQAHPDVAEVQVGVRTEAPTAAGALQANNAAMTRLLQVLNERGVAQKDRQTTQVQVSPLYSPPQLRQRLRGEDWTETVQRIVGYRVENSLRITARQLDKLGSLLDALIEGGANQLRGITFQVEHSEELLDKARTGAMIDALRKARILAESAGVAVGSPLRIEEHAGRIVPPPPRSYAGAAVAAPSAMPISAEEQELSVTVSVVFELVPTKKGPR